MAISVPIITTFDAKGVTRAIKDFKKLDGAAAKTGSVLASVDSGARKFAGAFTKMAAIGGTVAGVIGKNLVDAAVESQKVMAQTSAIIKSTGGAANLTAKQVSDLSRTLSEQVGIDDELIQSSANLLLTFKQVQNQVGENNDIFNRAMMAALDLGNVFGSVDSAAIQLGKALSDPEKGITALRRAGINFTDDQKALIKELVDTNRTLDAQKVILQEVESQVGGTAIATATDFDKMKVAVGNVAEDLGGLLLPAFNSFSQFVSKSVVPVMQTFTSVVGKEGIGAGLEYLYGSIVNAVAGMGTFGKVVIGISAGFAALRVATVTYTGVLAAMNVITTVSNGALSTLITRLGAARVAMVAAGGVTALLTVAATLYTIYAGQKAKATQQTNDFVNALMNEKTASSEVLADLIKNDSQYKIIVGSLERVGVTLDDVREYANSGTGAFKKYVDGLAVMDSTAGITMDKLKAFAKAVGVSMNETTKAGGSAAWGLSEFARIAVTMREEALKTQTAMSLLAGAGLKPTGDATASLDAELQKLMQDLKTTQGDTNGVGTAVKSAAEKFRTFAAALKGYGSDQKAYNASIKDTKRAKDELTKATETVTKAQERYDQVVRGFGAGSSQAQKAESDLTQATRDRTRANIEVSRAEQDVIDKQKALDDLRKGADPAALAQLEDDVTTAKFGQADAEKALADAQAKNDPRAVAEAQIQLRDAIAGVTAAESALQTARSGSDPAVIKAAQDELTLSQLALTEAKNAEIQATNDMATAQTALNEAINGAAVGSETYKSALDDLNTAKANEAAQADAVAEAVDRETTAKLNLADAEREVRAARTGLSADQVKRAQKQTGVQAPKKRPKKGKAAGGMVDAGYPYVVGERGREMFIPSTSGKIVPNNQLGGGDVYNITINSKIADETLGDVIVTELRKYNKRSGALNIVVA